MVSKGVWHGGLAGTPARLYSSYKIPATLNHQAHSQLSKYKSTNSLFYGTSNLCPGCQLEEETFEHVLRCSLPATVQFREEQLEVLSSNLKRIHTPEQVVITIMHGFQVWLTPTCLTSRAPTAGSLKGQDILLTTAYHEQLHSIGWYQLSLGWVGGSCCAIVVLANFVRVSRLGCKNYELFCLLIGRQRKQKGIFCSPPESGPLIPKKLKS
jgi:hypothetical protein